MFRFSIRELFLLTLIVAVASGWVVDHRSLATANVRIQAENDRLEIGRKLSWEQHVDLMHDYNALTARLEAQPRSGRVGPLKNSRD